MNYHQSDWNGWEACAGDAGLSDAPVSPGDFSPAMMNRIITYEMFDLIVLLMYRSVRTLTSLTNLKPEERRTMVGTALQFFDLLGTFPASLQTKLSAFFMDEAAYYPQAVLIITSTYIQRRSIGKYWKAMYAGLPCLAETHSPLSKLQGYKASNPQRVLVAQPI